MNCLWSGKLHKVQWEDQNMEASFFLFIFYSANQLCQLCGKWFKMDTRAVFLFTALSAESSWDKKPCFHRKWWVLYVQWVWTKYKKNRAWTAITNATKRQQQHQRVKKRRKIRGKDVTLPTHFDWQLIPGKCGADTLPQRRRPNTETDQLKQKDPRPPPPPDDHGRQNPVPKQWQQQARWEKKKQFAVFTAVTACLRRPWRQSPLLYALCDGGLFIDLALCVYANDSTSMLHLLLRGERESCCFWLTRCSLCVCVCVFIPHALGSVCSGGAHVTQLSYYVEASWRAVHKTVYTLQSLFI